MGHLIALNLIFFILPVCGATAFAFFVYRFLREGERPRPTSAGPDDLARSA
jgi:hypothetical protein